MFHTHSIRFAVSLCTAVLIAQLAFGDVQRVQVGPTGGFNQPIFATSAPGNPGTLYVLQQSGQIRTLNTATGVIGPTVLDIGPSASGTNFIQTAGSEQGLLGLAFHPNFQNNGLMYVNYTYSNAGTFALRVEQYTLTGGVADPASRRTVLEYNHPTNTNHNGGWIGFNPMANSQLYIMTGDGGAGNDPPNNAQNINVPLGKILRVDVGNGLSATNPAYSIPTGNMTSGGVLPNTVYSYGLRNPFRASFDRATGNLYIGDVGQSNREEVDFIANGSAGGQNFGWRIREGSIQNPAYPEATNPPPVPRVEPIIDYATSNAIGRAITGGYVYHGTATDDSGVALDGTYVFGDFVSGRIFSLRYDGTTVTDYRPHHGIWLRAGGADRRPQHLVLRRRWLRQFVRGNLWRDDLLDRGGAGTRSCGAHRWFGFGGHSRMESVSSIARKTCLTNGCQEIIISPKQKTVGGIRMTPNPQPTDAQVSWPWKLLIIGVFVGVFTHSAWKGSGADPKIPRPHRPVLPKSFKTRCQKERSDASIALVRAITRGTRNSIRTWRETVPPAAGKAI